MQRVCGYLHPDAEYILVTRAYYSCLVTHLHVGIFIGPWNSLITHAKAVLPTPAGPQISATWPRPRPPPLSVCVASSGSLPCRRASRLFNPVDMGRLHAEVRACSASATDKVGRRSGVVSILSWYQYERVNTRR